MKSRVGAVARMLVKMMLVKMTRLKMTQPRHAAECPSLGAGSLGFTRSRNSLLGLK
jgi:hypothetical protein